MGPMDVELNLGLLLDHAVRHASEVEIVTRDDDGTIRRYTYGAFGRRVNQLMNALDRLGLQTGDVVGTLAWNHDRHLEALFAVPCSGRVVHTLNPRISVADLAYTIGLAKDQVILVDPAFIPILEQMPEALRDVRLIVVMALDGKPRADSVAGVDAVGYDELIAGEPEGYVLAEVPERSPAGICFTSGTMGRPKGVVYSHRGSVLHAMALTSGAAFALSPSDTLCAQVPMFHVNCFGLPYAAAAVGAKQVFNTGPFDPTVLVDLLAAEEVTFSAGVTTIWQQVAADITRRGVQLPHLRRVVNGGSRPPSTLVRTFFDEFGIAMVNAFGMTEGTALLAVPQPKAYMSDWSPDELTERVRTTAGMPLAGVQMRIVEDAVEQPWDGTSVGRLQLRGPWVAGGYLGGVGAEQFTDDGWFDPGDAAVGSPDGYFRLVDRTKDLIKSGGEWISSVDMEEVIATLPQVHEVAVIGVPDEKWGERPLPCVVPAAAAEIDASLLSAHLAAAGFPRWQVSDRLEKLDALPRTSVGKVDKKALRARFAGHPEL